jgi:hypothetical protein
MISGGCMIPFEAIGGASLLGGIIGYLVICLAIWSIGEKPSKWALPGVYSIKGLLAGGALFVLYCIYRFIAAIVLSLL